MKQAGCSIKNIAFLTVLLLQIGAALYFGNLKTGYHYDEYYSYYSSNITVGLGPFDQTWMTGEALHDEFAVLAGEEFNFGRVVQMQSYDVHPPVYYLFLHALCSLVPGVFSKWTGIGLNLFFFVGNWILLGWLAWHAAKPMGKAAENLTTDSAAKVTADFSGQKWAVVLTCLLFGFCPAILSGIMLVRMYTMLGFWILLVTCLHVKAMESGKRGWKFYLSNAAVVFLGFLTHYYFAVYLFFLAAAMEGYLLLIQPAEAAHKAADTDKKSSMEVSGGKRNWKKCWMDCLVYGVVTVGAMLFAVVCYPASASHIFRGYRGTEAMGAFFDLSNTLDRLCFFVGLLNEYAFGSMLPLYTAVMAVLGAACVLQHRKRNKRQLEMRTAERGWKKLCGFLQRYRVRVLITFAALGYFAVVTKTALLTAEEANRYQIPIYGIVLMLGIVYFLALTEQVLSGKGYGKGLIAAAAACLMLGQIAGLCTGRVLFLYPEDAENISFALESREETIVYLFNDNVKWMVWDDSLELMQYDELYFVSLLNAENLQQPETFADERIADADRILVYCMRHENAETALDALMEKNPGLRECEKVRELLYCDLYEIR